MRIWDVSAGLGTKCPLCDSQQDSHEHLFFECQFSKLVWSRVKGLAGLPNIADSMEAVVSSITPCAKRKTSRCIIAKLVVAASAYFIWQERNSRLFKKTKRTENQIVECITSSVRLKLMSCRFKRSRDGLALMKHWQISESVIY